MKLWKPTRFRLRHELNHVDTQKLIDAAGEAEETMRHDWKVYRAHAELAKTTVPLSHLVDWILKYSLREEQHAPSVHYGAVLALTALKEYARPTLAEYTEMLVVNEEAGALSAFMKGITRTDLNDAHNIVDEHQETIDDIYSINAVERLSGNVREAYPEIFEFIMEMAREAIDMNPEQKKFATGMVAGATIMTGLLGKIAEAQDLEAEMHRPQF